MYFFFLIISYPVSRISEKIYVNYKVTKFLKKSDYESKIKSKEIKFDSKRGVYYVEVIFEDEPTIIYEYETTEDGGVYSMVYKDNFSIEEGKYRVNN